MRQPQLSIYKNLSAFQANKLKTLNTIDNLRLYQSKFKRCLSIQILHWVTVAPIGQLNQYSTILK